MFDFLRQKLKKKGFLKNDLSTKVKFNIILAFLVKLLSVLVNFILVPLTIGYVNSEKYGIWLTASSIIAWFGVFDFGLGNGLRNKLVQALSHNNKQEVKSLISSAYFSIFGVSSVLAICFLVSSSVLDWALLLNLPYDYSEEINQMMLVILLMFCLQFVLQLINVINFAYQRAALVSGIYLIGNIISLLFILGLKYYFRPHLAYLGVAYIGGNILSMLFFNIYFFRENRYLVPSFRYASFSKAKDILKLGGNFFVIQIASLIHFQTVNIIILRYFTPTEVTEYNVAYKLFSIMSIIFGILLAPIWSAVTKAYVEKDYLWIKKIEQRLLNIWMIAVLGIFLLYFASPIIYKIWIDDIVLISSTTNLGVAIYIITVTFGMIYVNMLNGMGRLKTQFYLSIIYIIVFIPITYFFAVKLNLGLIGISISLIITNVNGIIAAPIEFRRVLKNINSSH